MATLQADFVLQAWLSPPHGAYSAASRLCAEIAVALDAPRGLVERALCTSDNLLVLLETPEGWGTLARHVAAVLGLDPPDYQPALN